MISISVEARLENEIDDYTDRLFNYLDENDHLETHSILPSIELNSSPPTNQTEKEIKPLLCAFCPYFARNLQEFQIHIAKHTEKNFRCLLCNCMWVFRLTSILILLKRSSFILFPGINTDEIVWHIWNENTQAPSMVFENEKNKRKFRLKYHRFLLFNPGSMSQYIQKIHNPTNNGTTVTTPMKATPTNVESKRYGCPYCSLMTKSTSSIYKHQTRKHASYPKIVHKYSTDDPTTRSLVAILKQKPMSSKRQMLIN